MCWGWEITRDGKGETQETKINMFSQADAGDGVHDTSSVLVSKVAAEAFRSILQQSFKRSSFFSYPRKLHSLWSPGGSQFSQFDSLWPSWLPATFQFKALVFLVSHSIKRLPLCSVPVFFYYSVSFISSLASFCLFSLSWVIIMSHLALPVSARYSALCQTRLDTFCTWGCEQHYKSS